MYPNITKEKGVFKDLLEVQTTNDSEIGYEDNMERSLLEELKLKKLRQSEN